MSQCPVISRSFGSEDIWHKQSSHSMCFIFECHVTPSLLWYKYTIYNESNKQIQTRISHYTIYTQCCHSWRDNISGRLTVHILRWCYGTPKINANRVLITPGSQGVKQDARLILAGNSGPCIQHWLPGHQHKPGPSPPPYWLSAAPCISIPPATTDTITHSPTPHPPSHSLTHLCCSIYYLCLPTMHACPWHAMYNNTAG